MNKNQWFALYCDMPSVSVTAAEVEAALAAAPDDVDASRWLPDDLAACQAAQAAGMAVAWWQRAFAGDPVPDAWTDPHQNVWTKSADGHLSPPADLDIGRDIGSPDELCAWLWGYQRALAAQV